MHSVLSTLRHFSLFKLSIFSCRPTSHHVMAPSLMVAYRSRWKTPLATILYTMPAEIKLVQKSFKRLLRNFHDVLCTRMLTVTSLFTAYSPMTLCSRHQTVGLSRVQHSFARMSGCKPTRRLLGKSVFTNAIVRR